MPLACCCSRKQAAGNIEYYVSEVILVAGSCFRRRAASPKCIDLFFFVPEIIGLAGGSSRR